MYSDLQTAEQLAIAGDLDEAFTRYRAIASDERRSEGDRSVALASMATLVCASPKLDPLDQTGVGYLRQAVERDPANGYAWWRVIGWFGEHYPSHQDTALLRRAFDWLGSQSLSAHDSERLARWRSAHRSVLVTEK
jgi:hypothetical protein